MLRLILRTTSSCTGITYGHFDNDEYSGGIAFLAKFSPAGELLFQNEFSRGYGREICIDRSDDSIYVAFSSSSNFEGIEHQGMASSPDIFLLKFDSAGEKLWSVSISSDDDDSGEALAVDSSGNVYLGGHTRGDLGGTGVLGDYDFYIRKFSKEGALLKTVQFGSDTTDILTGLAIDSNDNIYMSGRTAGDFAATSAGHV